MLGNALRVRWALWALLALAPGPAGATDYVSEPLTGPGAGGSRGGSYSAAGWTTSAADDTLWWTVPDALESGSIQFDVTGLATGASLQSGDNDLFTLYQAPDGVAEPIGYSPWFRNNDQRGFIRVFSTAPGDSYNGAMKMEVTSCPVGPPYYDNTCPASCSALDGIAYCNGSPSDCGWDPAHTYHFEVSWGGGSISYARDGQVMGTVVYAPGTFSPQPLTVTLGSPRNGRVSGASIPIGVTYANMVISGTPGTRSPACDAAQPPVDGGPPVIAPCTDGSVGADQDVTAASWSPGVDPDPSDLNVEGDGASPTAIVYVRFPPTGGAVSQAALRLHTGAAGSSQGGSGQVCLVAPGAWDEGSLTWSARPAVTATCSGGARTVPPDTEVEWDVTALVNAAGGGDVSLALVSTDSDGAHFLSKESGGCAQGPRLAFTLAPPTTATSSSATASAAASSTGTAASGTAGGTTTGGATTGGASSGGATSGGATSGATSSAAGSSSAGASGSSGTGSTGSASTGSTGSKSATATASCGCASGGPSLLPAGLLLGAALRRRRR